MTLLPALNSLGTVLAELLRDPLSVPAWLRRFARRRRQYTVSRATLMAQDKPIPRPIPSTNVDGCWLGDDCALAVGALEDAAALTVTATAPGGGVAMGPSHEMVLPGGRMTVKLMDENSLPVGKPSESISMMVRWKVVS